MRNRHVEMRKGSQSTRDDVKLCGIFEKPFHQLHGPVAQCTNYYPKHLPSRADYEKIAWEISTDKRTGKVGFLTPKERKKAGMMPNQYGDDDD